MPGMDGIELTRRLKGDFARPPRVVMVTAFGHDEVRQDAEAAGADGFLVKPVDASMLLDALVSMLGPESAGGRPTAGYAPAPHFDGATVLLVDDNSVNRQIAAELLEASGVAVEVAVNGREALDALWAAGPDHFDAVLMDIQMPVMGGYEAMGLLRADPRFSRLPVIAMTAHAMQEERERCLQAGMNDHVAKPVDPERLYQVLARWLKASIATGPAGGSHDLRTDRFAGPPFEQALRAVPGVQVDDALARVRGRWPVYESLLRQFLASQADALATCRAVLDDGRGADAERVLHTLRGTAGTVGASEVARLAGEAERVLVAGSEPATLARALAVVEGALASLMARLGQALPPAEPTPRVDVDWAAVRGVLDELEHLLAKDDVRAVDLFRRQAAPLERALGPHFRSVERDVLGYAMVEALEAIRVGRRAVAALA
jgi:CheY-like chemotaxis protein/HPt (histidine-containing phosphotransfer) domain-containing protein